MSGGDTIAVAVALGYAVVVGGLVGMFIRGLR